MDGGTIFSKNNTTPPQPQGAQPQAPGTSVPQQPAVPSTEIPLNQLPHDIKAEGKVVQPQSPPPPGSQPPTSPPMPPPSPPAGFSKGLLIKIGLGVLGVGLLVFLIFGVIMPFFTKGSSQEKDQEANLIYWGLWENENTMNVLIKEFEQKNPTIKVKYIKQDPVNYREKVQAQVGKENGPDIFRYHNSWTPMLVDELAPLPVDVIKPEIFEETYYPVIADDVMVNGGIYGIPLGFDTLSMFVNREIIRDFDVPRDWEDFAEVAREVTVKDADGNIKTSGAALGTLENVNHAQDIVAMMMLQSGADLYGDSVASDKSKAAMVSALEYYMSFASGDEKIWDGSMQSSLQTFAAGDVAMYFGYSWDIFQMKQLNPKIEFEVYPVPSLSKGRDMTVASYWVEGVANQSPEQDAAFTFMKFLSEKATLQKFYTTVAKTRDFGELYPMKTLKNSLRSNKMLYPFLEQGERAQSSYFVSDTHDEDGLTGQMNNYLLDAYLSMTTSNTSAETAVDTLVSGIQSIRSQYGF